MQIRYSYPVDTGYASAESTFDTSQLPTLRWYSVDPILVELKYGVYLPASNNGIVGETYKILSKIWRVNLYNFQI